MIRTALFAGLIIAAALVGATGVSAGSRTPRAGASANSAALSRYQDGLQLPTGLAMLPSGELLVTDIGSHRVLLRERSGRLRVIAGTGKGGFSGDGGPAAQARLHAPHDVAVDSMGRIYIADTYNHRIRRVDQRGVIQTIAGNGNDRLAGDLGPAVKASLSNPQGIGFTADGRLLIADTYHHVIRVVDKSGIIRRFVGTEAGLSGDGGPAERAQISLPMAVAGAPDGSVYLCDTGNNRIRRVTAEGVISTIAGSGPGSGTAGAGFGGDGGPVGAARLFAPSDIKVLPSGEVLFSDSGNNRVRKISSNVVDTVAGSGDAGYGGDGGPASQAKLNTPQKILVSPDGVLFVTDRLNGRIRRISTDRTIETLPITGGTRGRSGSK